MCLILQAVLGILVQLVCVLVENRHVVRTPLCFDLLSQMLLQYVLYEG